MASGAIPDLHAKAGCAARDGTAYPAHAEHSQTGSPDPARQRELPQALPVPVPHVTIRHGRLPCDAKKQSPGQIGHTFVQHIRRIADLDATGISAPDVQSVETRPPAAYCTEGGQLIEPGAIAAVANCRHQRAYLTGMCVQPFVRPVQTPPSNGVEFTGQDGIGMRTDRGKLKD